MVVLLILKNILEKKAKKYVDLCNKNEIRELAYKWVLFQYKIEELNDFIDTIRAEETLQDDMESENGLFSGQKGNNSLELENSLKEYFINDYI